MKRFIRSLRHPLGIVFIVLLLFVGGAVGARYVAWPFYKDWRERRWITMAEEFHQKDDLRSAGLLLRKVIDANPASLKGWEMILSISKEEDGPGLLGIYKQVAVLKPDDEELHLDWATTAIRRGKFEEAKVPLEKLEGNDTATYHRLAAAFGIGTKDMAAAERHFQRLSELEPADQQVALNLAIVRLQSDDAEKIQQARQTLLRLSEEEGAIHVAALRALLTDALAKNLDQEGRAYTEKLRSAPEPGFGERLLILRALDRYDRDAYEAYLKKVMAAAEGDVAAIRALARFLNARAQRARLREWIEALPEEFRDDQEVNMQYIETLVFLEDLPALEARLRTLPWERDDFYRNAILARTLREQGREREAAEAWQRAVIASADNARDQRLLYLQAKSWNWESERLDLLSRIYQRNPREQWAFVELFAHYQTARDTPKLTELFARQVEVNREDVQARNNLAYLWLLRETHLSRAYALAQEIYRQEPENPQFRTTYAFSLYRQGRFAESLKVFEEMEDAQLNDPQRSLHYSLILAANEKWEQALAASEKVPEQNLFPEEDRLLAKIKSEIVQHL